MVGRWGLDWVGPFPAFIRLWQLIGVGGGGGCLCWAQTAVKRE
jgi:hypothetical protein